jgi:hypothetical protein
MTKLIVASRTFASGSKKLTGFALCWRRDISCNPTTNFLYIFSVGLRRLCHDAGHQWRSSHHGSPLSFSSTMHVAEKAVLGRGFFCEFFSSFWQFHSTTAPYSHFIFIPPTFCNFQKPRRLKTTDFIPYPANVDNMVS